MGDGEANLTGEWTGIYSYPAHYPPNTFEASIRDAGGAITGVIRQPGGDEIEGEWHIPGNWSGRFMMIRRREESAAEEREVSEEIEAR